jgi:hypothetical protein
MRLTALRYLSDNPEAYNITENPGVLSSKRRRTSEAFSSPPVTKDFRDNLDDSSEICVIHPLPAAHLTSLLPSVHQKSNELIRVLQEAEIIWQCSTHNL